MLLEKQEWGEFLQNLERKNPNPGPENLGGFGQGLRDKRSLRKSSWTAKFSKNSPKAEDGREREMIPGK